MMLVSSPNTIASPPIVPDQNGFTAFPPLQFGECCGPIAGTIADLGASSSSTFIGVAPEANLVDVKVMDVGAMATPPLRRLRRFLPQQ
jgi:hypothetical protein